MPDFIPNGLGDFAAWVRLQTTKRPAHAATLGLSADDVARRNTADQAVLDQIAAADAALSQARAAVAARDHAHAIDAYETGARADIARAKTHTNYTDALGRDCQWLAAAADVNRDALKPTLRQRPSAEGVRLDWSKNGRDGVQVFRRPAGTAEWGRPLAFDSRSPYIDAETGLRGTYEYCVQLLKDDKPVGERSDVVAVALG